MKRFLALLLAVCLAGLLASVPMAAAQQQYIDPCSSASSNEVAQYRGIEPVLNVGENWGHTNLPDKTALALPVSGAESSIVYRVSGAERLQLSFYKPRPSFMVYAYGNWYPDMVGKELPQERPPLFLNPKDGVAYGQAGEQVYQMMNDHALGMPMLPVDGKLPDGVVNLGVQVAYSRDGQQYTDLLWRSNCDQVRVFDSAGNKLFLERRDYAIPSDANYLRISLNDFTHLPDSGGGAPVINSTPQPVLLAEVTIAGKELHLGVPVPPDSSRPDPPPASSSEPPLPPSSSGGANRPGGGDLSDGPDYDEPPVPPARYPDPLPEAEGDLNSAPVDLPEEKQRSSSSGKSEKTEKPAKSKKEQTSSAAGSRTPAETPPETEVHLTTPAPQKNQFLPLLAISGAVCAAAVGALYAKRKK